MQESVVVVDSEERISSRSSDHFAGVRPFNVAWHDRVDAWLQSGLSDTHIRLLASEFNDVPDDLDQIIITCKTARHSVRLMEYAMRTLQDPESESESDAGSETDSDSDIDI
jgi:hypothetical protein